MRRPIVVGMRRYARNGWPPTSEEADGHLDATGEHDEMILLAALTAFDEAIERDRESGLAWLGRSAPYATKGIMMRLRLQSYVLAD